ncbi:UvrD-helicase domain-containing protein [bacterium]|nr:UvrD-helicase domain-containing protein [bacterium]MBU1614770.1 UvrD-helicase domain-containing protein [bacterium]
MKTNDFPHIQVLAASAGSGKTSALSKRYIDFLLSPAIRTSPRNILAITFTNKAAMEMKERIISDLKKIALGNSDQREAAGEKIDELLDKYSDLKILTIDSFLTSVIISSALELGLPPGFEIVLDSSSALNFVLDELLSEVYPDGQNRAPFVELLNEICQIDPEINWDIRRIILESIGRLRNQKFLRGQRLKGGVTYKDVQAARKSLKRLVEEFLLMAQDELDLRKDFTKAANNLIEDKHYLPWESRVFLREEVRELCKKGKSPGSRHQKIWEEIRGELSFLAETTGRCHFAPFINIVSLFDAGIQSFKDQGQIIFIEELNLLLKEFLDREGVVPQIYFHLGDRITHFFIDEFQDTSRLQWESLFPLIEEALSKRGSLFYVGDKKQAIYGFRGGESALFDQAKRSFASVQRPDEESREINYRSRGNIVSFVNETFSGENLTRWAAACKIDEEIADLSLLSKTYIDSAQRPALKNKGGLVRIEKISPDTPLNKEGLEAETKKHLVRLIKDDLLLRFSPGKIAVLVRTNTEAAWITGLLSGAGIPVASEKTLDISSNHLVCELVSFLLFLDSPIDDFSFASFISGEIFLKATGLAREKIFSFLLKYRKIKRPLYPLFRDEFKREWQDYLEEYFNSVGFLPPYDLTGRILKKYDVFSNFPDEEGFFYQLLEVLKQCEGEGKNSLKEFLRRWSNEEEKREDFQVVLPAYTNAVRVQTIHKAKGLEFPVVIYPSAYLKKRAINEIYEKSENEFIPYRINKKQIEVSGKLKKLYQKELASQLTDELNAFYVATTRACDELYVFMPNYRSKREKLPVPILFEEEVFVIGHPVSQLPEAERERKKHIYPPLANEWQDKLCRLPIYADELADSKRRQAKQRGTLIHNFLAQIERLHPDRWKEELVTLFSSLPKETVPLMSRFFDNDDLRRWFILPDDTSVSCEKEIVDQNGQLYRADRVLVWPKKVVVIEFKSGEPRSKEHRQQLLNYLKLIAGIYPDKTVSGWLIYVDEAVQEKVMEDTIPSGE